jgi:hypothetical protein
VVATFGEVAAFGVVLFRINSDSVTYLKVVVEYKVQGQPNEDSGGLLQVSTHMVATARIYAYRSFQCDRSMHGSSIEG